MGSSTVMGHSQYRGQFWVLAATVVALALASVSEVNGQGLGSWQLLVQNAGIASMHTVVTHYGTVILLDHTNTGASNISLPNGECRIAPWDHELKKDCWAHSVMLTPGTQTVRPLLVETDTWCSSGQMQADGTLVQTGGDYEGFSKIRTLTPCPTWGKCDWVETNNTLQNGRWYSTNQILPDGRQIVVGGRSTFTLEFVPPKGQGLVYLPLLAQTNDNQNDNYYPFVHLLPNGDLYIFANRDSIIYNYKNNTVVKSFPQIPGNPRNYPSAGSSVLLPLSYVNGFSTVEVLVCGGAQYGAATIYKAEQLPTSTSCGRISVTDPNPKWTMEYMPIPRCMGDMVLLPDKNVLIINGAQRGSQGWQSASMPALNPVLYKTYNSSARFVTLKATTIPRMYHSTAALLPSGSVVIAGSNVYQFYKFATAGTPVDFPTELRVESFTPPYAGGSNLKPYIFLSVKTVTYGQMFGLDFWDPSTIIYPDLVEVVLTSTPFVTHSFSQGQRLVNLKVWYAPRTPNKKTWWDHPGGPPSVPQYRFVSVTAPPNSAVAPAAYYMMWVVKNGDPSYKCHWIKVGP